MYLWMQMVQIHNRFPLIYVVTLLYSTCLNLEMTWSRTKSSISLFFSFSLSQQMRRLPHKIHDSFKRGSNQKKRDSYDIKSEQKKRLHQNFDIVDI